MEMGCIFEYLNKIKMGYSFTIGNAKMEYDKEYSSISIVAESNKLDNAPAFNEPTDYTSQRWPSYTQWVDFCRFVGLYELFFDKDFEGDNQEKCLVYSHPGHTVITEYHKSIIDNAYDNFYKKYPNCVAGYSPKATDFFDDPDWPIENNYACRLEWLKFWIDWSLKNCEVPIFENM